MPTADQVAVKSPHSMMLWRKWVVPIIGMPRGNISVAPAQLKKQRRRRNNEFADSINFCQEGPASNPI
jgi:hypothetical protein